MSSRSDGMRGGMEEEEGVGWMAMRMGDRERGSQRNDRRQARAGYPFRALARGIDGRAGLRLNLRVRMVMVGADGAGVVVE